MRFIRDAILTIIVLIGVAAIVGYLSAAGGLSAASSPGPVEHAVAARLVRLSIPQDAKNARNPFSDPSTWRAAADHYEDHCATCHGSDGRGHTEMGENMYPKVPDLTSSDIQQFSDGALYYIIQNGVRWTGMPAWAAEHSVTDSWQLVSFIRHLPEMPPAEQKSEGDEHHHHPDETPQSHDPSR